MNNRNRRNVAAARWVVVVVLAAAVAVVALLLVNVLPGRAAGPSAEQSLATVRSGPLTISVTESGTIKAREQVIIKSEVEGNTTIIFLIPEGTRVKKGELLVELDASRLDDSKVDQEIRVQNSEAAHIRAKENLEVTRSQSKSDVSRAQLDYDFAKEDLQQYLDGEYPKQLLEAENRITLAEEDKRLADIQVEWSERLLAEKYISQNEFDKDELAQTRAKLDLQLAQENRKLLEQYTHKRKLTELNSDIEQAEMALERVQRKANADEIQAKADLKAKLSEFNQQQKKLDKIIEQIAKAKIHAPIDGMVVYATSAQASWRGNTEPLDEGQSVRERQELIHLPTADAMMAEIKIHESSLDKVSLGLDVRVTVDALPGSEYWGKVTRIAPLPDAASRWMNPDLKVFSTHIHLDGKGDGLRTGMTCRAEIIVKEFEDAVYVPVQAVVRNQSNVPKVWLVQGSKIVAQTVEIGMDNNKWVRILSGLEPQQQILIPAPLAEAAADLLAAAADESSDAAPTASSRRRRSRPAPDTSADTGQPETAQTEAPKPAADQVEEGERPRRAWGQGERRGQADGEGASGADQRGGDRSARRGRGDRGNMTEEQREAMRKRFESMTDEQREEMRKRFQNYQNMSEEERQKLRQQFQGGGGASQ